MKKSLSILLSNILPLVFIVSVTSAFCANTTNFHQESTKKTSQYTDTLSFDLLYIVTTNLSGRQRYAKDANRPYHSRYSNSDCSLWDEVTQPSPKNSRAIKLFDEYKEVLTLCAAKGEKYADYQCWFSHSESILKTAILDRVPVALTFHFIDQLKLKDHLDVERESWPIFLVSMLRFAHSQDSESKSIVKALMKTRKNKSVNTHSNNTFSFYNAFNVLTPEELQSLVMEEHDYIKSTYKSLHHCAALILRRRDPKQYASGLPAELLVNIMNYAVEVELTPEIYEKIIGGKIQCTDEDANSSINIDDNNTV